MLLDYPNFCLDGTLLQAFCKLFLFQHQRQSLTRLKFCRILLYLLVASTTAVVSDSVIGFVGDFSVVFANYYAAIVEPCTEAHILEEKWQISIKC